MSTTPMIPNVPFGTSFPSNPVDDDISMGERQNAHSSFSPTGSQDSLDNFEFISESSSAELLPTASKLKIFDFIESICQDFTPPRDITIPDHKIIAIFSTIAAKNALPVEPGNTYTVFEHANQLCNLENAVRTLAADGSVTIKTATCNDHKELIISPQETVIKNFSELIQWDAL